VDVQEPGKNQPVQTFVTNLTYTALGQPKAWNWNCLTGSGASAASTANCDSASRTFDANGRMTANEFASYSFDAAGRITNITQNLWALQAAVPEVPATSTSPAVPATPASYYQVPFNWTAGYDNRDRLTSFTRPGSSISYTYDKNSNRLSSTDTTTSDTDLDGDFDAADLQRASAQILTIALDSNRLLGWSQINTTKRLNTRGQPVTSSTSTQVNYGLDAAGNLTSDGLRTFSYDASNRLSQVQVGDADEASKVTYLHNAAGQRVFKSEPQVAQTAPSEAELGADFITWLKKNFGWLFAQAQQNATLGQSYVYGDDQIGSYNLLGEYGNGGTKSAGRMEYIYLPTETGTAQLIGLYKNNRFYAVHTDHLGTPRSITDDTNKVVWQWAYSAFGDNKPTGILKATTNPKAAITNQPKLLTATSPSFAVNLRFPGQYWDDESKLSYNYFRSYRPAQGRYDQFDPIGLAGGPNAYLYANANPLSYVDPTGEVGIVGAGVGAGLELAIQAYKNYSDGCDVFDADNYDWWDVGVSAAVGAVAPGALSVGKTAWTSGNAAKTIAGQLTRARTANRAAKLQARLDAHTGAITEAVATQASWQGYKFLGKQLDGNKQRDCTCKK